MQREAVGTARHEARLEEAARERARDLGREAHEAPVAWRNRTVRVECDVRAAGEVDEPQTREQRALAPRRADHHPGPLRVDDAERLALLAGQERRDARDRAHRRSAVLRRRRLGDLRRCDDLARIERSVEQIGDTVDDQPARRTVEDERAGRRNAHVFGGFEHGHERGTLALRAQAHTSGFDRERRQLRGMPVVTGRVVEAQPRMTRQTEQRTRQGFGGCARPERLLHRVVAQQ